MAVLRAKLRAKIEAKAQAQPKILPFYLPFYPQSLVLSPQSRFRPFLAKRISVEMAKKNGNNHVHFHGTPKPGPSFQFLKWPFGCCQIFGVISKTAQLTVENSTKTTSRLSPISYCAPALCDKQFRGLSNFEIQMANLMLLTTF